jgi:Tol biopolymer transport system component
MRVHLPRWSPDGKQIAFAGDLPGRPWKVYLVSAEGGNPQQAMPESKGDERDPGWSPDGNSLIFGLRNPNDRAIYLLDLRTRQLSPLAGSNGLFSPRWSPDGRYIAAMPPDGQALLLFDLRTQKWSELTRAPVSYPNWSRDGKYIYFQNGFREDWPLLRVGVGDRKIEQLASLKNLRVAWGLYGTWMGLAPDDSPMVLRDVGTQDIYALDWQAP